MGAVFMILPMWRPALRVAVVRLGNSSSAVFLVADELGVSEATVDSWLHDERQPSKQNQQRILAYYHLITEEAS
jgi:predicted transcriptional regulator